MTSAQALTVLENMADSAELDGDLVAIVRNEFEPINSIRVDAQQTARNEYGEFFRRVEESSV